MLREAVKETAGRCRILAVTVLTSLDMASLASIGVPASPVDWALKLGGVAMAAGCAGIVCSAEEATAVRARHPDAFLVTPGIRTEPGQDDQARVATPEAAIRAGADLLVVGRPIRNAPDPRAAARAIVERIGSAVTGR